VRALRLKFSDWDVIAGALTAMAVTTFCGAAVLLGPDRGLGDALFQAASAFGNSGLYTGALPGLNDWRTYFVLLPLATLGGLGMPVLMELYQLAVWSAERLFDKSSSKSRGDETTADEPASIRPTLSEHARTAVKVTAALYLGGFLLLMLTRDEFWENLLPGMSHGGPAQGAAVRYALLSSSAAAINGRSAGFPFEYTDLLPRASQWVLMLLMVIGANPAGTGGGIKGTTVVQLIRGGLGRRLCPDRLLWVRFAALAGAPIDPRPAADPERQRRQQRRPLTRLDLAGDGATLYIVADHAAWQAGPAGGPLVAGPRRRGDGVAGGVRRRVGGSETARCPTPVSELERRPGSVARQKNPALRVYAQTPAWLVALKR
jgi:hypothetical protein